jgi:hypothetical protein
MKLSGGMRKQFEREAQVAFGDQSHPLRFPAK